MPFNNVNQKIRLTHFCPRHLLQTSAQVLVKIFNINMVKGAVPAILNPFQPVGKKEINFNGRMFLRFYTVRLFTGIMKPLKIIVNR